jgi:hypothetical protein
MKSSSSGQPVPTVLKLREWGKQFGGLVRSRAPWVKRDYSGLEFDLEKYRGAARTYGGFELSEAVAFEIGCGQRPYRLFYAIAEGIDAYAVDLDKVTMDMSLTEFLSSLRNNGLERSFKTLLRNVLFDGADNKAFKAFLSARRTKRFEWPMDRIQQGSAAEEDCWPKKKVDFVFSEDVFEHIPPDVLPAVCEQMRLRMTPRGIAWVKPLVFTGIQGGHSVDWYNVNESKSRDCPPWDHLRGRKFPANTYLNQLRRSDYRLLFSKWFDILEERVVQPDLGRNFMTQEIRAELAEFSDEDLFSNGVAFVLRPK